MNPEKLLARIQRSATNIRFSDVERLARALGFFRDRTRGSHRIYIHSTHREAQLNLQPDSSGQAKPYQVKQLLALVEDYNLSLDR